MKLGKRTAKLLREAVVLAYVEGHHHGRYADQGSKVPPDSEIVRTVLISSTRLAEQFPTLARLDVAQKADEEFQSAFYGALKADIAAPYPTAEDRDEHAAVLAGDRDAYDVRAYETQPAEFLVAADDHPPRPPGAQPQTVNLRPRI